MATVIDELVTRFTLDSKDYVTSAQIVVGATDKIGGALSKVKSATLGIGAAIIGSSFVGIGVAASKASADMEALKAGLVAVTGSVQAANSEFNDLKEVAKLPGLGVKEAVEGAVALQAAGLSAERAKASLLGFGNALATVGKGKDDLQGVILALTQISAKGKITAEDIMQIQERVPQIRKLMQAAFGTADTEQLQKMGISADQFIDKINAQLATLPRVAGGTKNSFENLGDAINAAMVKVGDGINKYASPAINGLGDTLGRASAPGGPIDRIVAGFNNLFSQGGTNNGLTKALAAVLATLVIAPKVLANFRDKVADAFNEIRTHAGAFSALLGAIFLGPGIFNGIMAIVAAVRTLVTAIRAAGIAGAIMQAILSRGAAIAQVIITGLIGAAAGYAIYRALDSSISGATDPNKPSPYNWRGEYSKILDELTGPTGQPANSSTPTNSQTINNGQGVLGQIASNTARTAQNTDPKSLQRMALGGGELGRIGVTPVELSAIRRASGGRLDSKIRELVQAIHDELSASYADQQKYSARMKGA